MIRLISFVSSLSGITVLYCLQLMSENHCFLYFLRCINCLRNKEEKARDLLLQFGLKHKFLLIYDDAKLSKTLQGSKEGINLLVYGSSCQLSFVTQLSFFFFLKQHMKPWLVGLGEAQILVNRVEAALPVVHSEEGGVWKEDKYQQVILRELGGQVLGMSSRET